MNRDSLLIDVAGLARSYAGRTAVEGVSLQVAPGDFVGLVGANGGGKTTTLRMIAGLLRPDSGGGSVLGEAIGTLSRAGRARLGYMTQRLALYPDLSVRENLCFRAGAYGVATPQARINELAATYGIAHVMDQRFGKLSGGWARRVQFVATVLPAPSLLLLDEPTAGLDPATRQDIWNWLEHLAANGTAVVLATHDLTEAERLRSIVLYHQGRASLATTPARLMAAHNAATLEQAVIAQARMVAA